ncbi:MAG: aromatic ring-hydroxylating dioxygenase subunit alpha [Alphaproteobacteria bacterium]|nr:aromatic ring-hydroxylating dioxygenase subunit alpha [Alphaproteobacteria bacterium]
MPYDIQSARALIRETEVHRDIYTSPEVFDLEMKHVFGNAWVYVGHASQIPAMGDFITTTIGVTPVVMVRRGDGGISVLYNRCPHKGTRVANELCGNAGRFFRCPYHAWSFRLDGSIAAIPMPDGYAQTEFKGSEAAKGMTPVAGVHVYRDFVFARLAGEGIGFEDFFGDSLSSLDNMVDRSPVGKLEVAGGVLRYLHHCNYKMLMENLTDTCHPMVAHESSAGTAVAVWNTMPAGTPKHPAVEIYAPFMSSYQAFDSMGIQVWPNGHGHTGVSHSIHSDYSAIPGYYEQMVAAHGEEKARRILDTNRHNTAYFPNMTMKGPIQALRIFKPIAADKTMVESWTFRLVGAPNKLLERTLMYSRLINAPTSPVGHDDLEMYERAQDAMHADGNVWINTQRNYEAGETAGDTAVTNGTTERQMRNQLRAWKKFMAEVVVA